VAVSAICSAASAGGGLDPARVLEQFRIFRRKPERSRRDVVKQMNRDTQTVKALKRKN
jgi:hypothetical protein